MFFNLTSFDLNIFQTAYSPKIVYDKLSFYGDIDLDDVNVLNVELTDNEIENITTEQIWDVNTVLLGHFENTLSAGNVVSQDGAIDGWVIKRKKHTDLLYDTLVSLPQLNISPVYYDYTAKNLQLYDYTLHAVANNIEGLGIGGSAQLDFFGWSLSGIGATPITSYVFDLENQTNDVTTNEDKMVYNNYTRFPAFRFGNRSYESGNLSTMPYSINGERVIVDSSVLDTLKAFINNKQSKTLRNSAGRVWTVITSDFAYKYIDEIPEQPYKISFNWTQIGEG